MLKNLHFFQRGCFSFAWTLWFQSQNRPCETSLIRGKQALFSQTQPAAPTDTGIFGGAGLKMKLQLRIPHFQSQRSRHVNIPHRPAHLTVGHQQWLSGAGDGPDGMEKCCCGGERRPREPGVWLASSPGGALRGTRGIGAWLAAGAEHVGIRHANTCLLRHLPRNVVDASQHPVISHLCDLCLAKPCTVAEV